MVEYLKLIRSYNDRCMVKMLDGENSFSKSYADYYIDMCITAKKLESILGEVKDRHIGIIGSNSYEYMVLMAAVLFSRAVVVPINNHEADENIFAAIKKADLDLLVVLDEINSFSKNDCVMTICKPQLFTGSTAEKELYDFSPEEGSRTSFIIFTSGSTSLAKGVELSIEGILNDLRNNMPENNIGKTQKDTSFIGYINNPCYHIGGLLPWLRWTAFGYTICMSVDPRNILSDLEHTKIDFAGITPAVLKLWFKCLQKHKKERLGGVKYIFAGGAELPPSAVDLFASEGITLIQLYGMTETGGDVTINYDMVNHRNSVGKAAYGVELSIIEGEICVNTQTNMKGYYKKPEETDKVLKKGIIYTGDLGYIDEEGYLYITGRKKNLIILSGGENVSPFEIEAKLYENPLIKECKVYEKNDRIAVDIFAPSGSEKEIKQYIDIINTKLPIYKRIYNVFFRDTEFEKTAIGKIKR